MYRREIKKTGRNGIELPTTTSLKTLRKRAGKARAIITKTNSTNPPLITPGFLSQGALQQNRGRSRTEEGYSHKSKERAASNFPRISNRLNYNQEEPTQNVRRSLRLVEKHKKIGRETVSRFFSQPVHCNNDGFSKRFDEFGPSSNGISTYFSQQISTSKHLNRNSSFKLAPVVIDKEPPNTHSKRKKDSDFKLLPVNSNPESNLTSPDITSPNPPESASGNVNWNFEAALCDQIKVQWATDVASQFYRTLRNAFDKINSILSGEMMPDHREIEDYARTYLALSRDEESEHIVLDQKIYNNHTTTNNNNNHRGCPAHQDSHAGGDGGNVLKWDGGFPVPPSRWVYRTPEKKKHQQPRLDERTGLRCGLVRSSRQGAVSVYRVNRQFEGGCFVGDAANVPLSARFFSHVGDFESRQAAVAAAARHTEAEGRDRQVRFLKVKTSTAQDEEDEEMTTARADWLNQSLDISSIDAEDGYDPFLITRPTKAKSTISRKELFEMKRPLDDMEVDDPTLDSNSLPKKRLFTRDAAIDEEYDDCTIMN